MISGILEQSFNFTAYAVNSYMIAGPRSRGILSGSESFFVSNNWSRGEGKASKLKGKTQPPTKRSRQEAIEECEKKAKSTGRVKPAGMHVDDQDESLEASSWRDRRDGAASRSSIQTSAESPRAAVDAAGKRLETDSQNPVVIDDDDDFQPKAKR